MTLDPSVLAFLSAGTDVLSGIMQKGAYKTEAKWARINSLFEQNALDDVLLQGLAQSQQAAAASGFMLTGSIAMQQMADLTRAERDKRLLAMQARATSARLNRQGTDALLSGFIKGANTFANAYVPVAPQTPMTQPSP